MPNEILRMGQNWEQGKNIAKLQGDSNCGHCATDNVFHFRRIIASTDISSYVFGKHYKSDLTKWEGIVCSG